MESHQALAAPHSLAEVESLKGSKVRCDKVGVLGQGKVRVKLLSGGTTWQCAKGTIASAVIYGHLGASVAASIVYMNI